MDLLWHDDDHHRVEFVTGFDRQATALACLLSRSRPTGVRGGEKGRLGGSRPGSVSRFGLGLGHAVMTREEDRRAGGWTLTPIAWVGMIASTTMARGIPSVSFHPCLVFNPRAL
jgi:hypothetical protein